MQSELSIQRDAKALLAEYLRSGMYPTDRPVSHTVDWLMPRIENTYLHGGTLVDLGGGYSVVNAVLAQLGMRVFTVDLMGDYQPIASLDKPDRNERILRREQWLAEKGVNHIQHDLLNYDFSDFPEDSVDVICSYHCFEHLHHGPKLLGRHIRPTLKAGGTFFLELPNSVNLLKRLKVIIGKTNYEAYPKYFHAKQFFGHVREYSIGDLRYLAEQFGFEKYSIFGRNHFGNLYGAFGYGFLPKVVDRGLRFRPGLCSSIFLKARK